MRLSTSACLVLLYTAGLSRAGEATLKDARERWLRGNYAEALDKYKALLKDDKSRAEAAIGVSRCLQSEGEYDRALEAVESAPEGKNEGRPAAGAAGGTALPARPLGGGGEGGRGRPQDRQGQLPGPLGAAQIYRDRGDLKKADAEFRWFVKTYSQASDKDKDVKDPEALVLIGQAGTENARWHKLADQFEFILQEVYGDALKADKSYWPAEYHAGMLLLEKYNRAEGLAALDKALTINASCRRGPCRQGRSSPAAAGDSGRRALRRTGTEDQSNLPEALRLRADVYQASGDTVKALKELGEARKVNPRDERTLGRIAACLLLQRKPAEVGGALKEVKKYDPKPAEFHFALAERLEEPAATIRPKSTSEGGRTAAACAGAANSLGMLYMRLGREKEAAELLDKAVQGRSVQRPRLQPAQGAAPPGKVRDAEDRSHFELRYDPEDDAALAHYMAAYLEEDLRRTVREVSVSSRRGRSSSRSSTTTRCSAVEPSPCRTCTPSAPVPDAWSLWRRPTRPRPGQPFNWGRVIRHEMVHIFNLEQTHFLVPHWLTEGLAVSNEGFARPAVVEPASA